MENIILSLIFAILLKDILCNDDLLSKFHQHGYKIKDFRIQLMDYNKSAYNFFEIKAFKYNRTTTAHNGTINLKIDTGDKLEVVVQVYKFLSNEYRHFPIRFQVNAQKAFHANAIGLSSVKQCGNITSFIFQKDITYKFCNFVIDEKRFPPLIPTGKFKIEVTVTYYNTYIALINGFGEVYIPFPYPKK